MRICDFHDKEVVNIKDGCILGCVADVDFDCKTGCICALVVPGPSKLCGLFGRDVEYVIPFKCVVNIGADVILVDVILEKVTFKCN
ncbi:MAG: YlmC/YmxH family sporulation protein [Bacteroides sp.]